MVAQSTVRIWHLVTSKESSNPILRKINLFYFISAQHVISYHLSTMNLTYLSLDFEDGEDGGVLLCILVVLGVGAAVLF